MHKKPINQLALEQLYRISALQIIGYSSSMGLHAGIPKQIMFDLKIPFFDHFESKKVHFRGFWALYAGYDIYFAEKIHDSPIHI